MKKYKVKKQKSKKVKKQKSKKVKKQKVKSQKLKKNNTSQIKLKLIIIDFSTSQFMHFIELFSLFHQNKHKSRIMNQHFIYKPFALLKKNILNYFSRLLQKQVNILHFITFIISNQNKLLNISKTYILLFTKLSLNKLNFISSKQINLYKMESSLQQFKYQIQAMFQKTFQQLNQKNQLNKNILQNLMQAATKQTYQINQLDRKLQNVHQELRGSNPSNNTGQNQAAYIKKQVRRHQQMVHDNFNMMMQRLQQIQDGIASSRRSMQSNVKSNQQTEQKMDKMINQMQDIIRKQNIPEYKGDREALVKEIEDFEAMLKAELEKQRNLSQNIEFSKKTTLQPLNTFQTKMTIHNKANQQILSDKLSTFTDKIRKLQKKVQQTTWMMNSQISKSSQQQRKIIQQMNMLQNQMARMRTQLQTSDQKRKQIMQSNAMSLDNMVQEMLSQAKKLEVRVEGLKRGYEDENEKLRRRVGEQKMTI